jgi:hypothetical protein
LQLIYQIQKKIQLEHLKNNVQKSRLFPYKEAVLKKWFIEQMQSSMLETDVEGCDGALSKINFFTNFFHFII